MGVGVDVEAVSRFATPPRGVFADVEVAYCLAQADPAESFAGTWTAKEAVLKALSGWGRLSVREVVITRDDTGAPKAALVRRQRAAPSGSQAAQPELSVSIAHAAGFAVAVAVARWQPQRD